MILQDINIHCTISSVTAGGFIVHFVQLSVYWLYYCYKPLWWWSQHWPKHVVKNNSLWLNIFTNMYLLFVTNVKYSLMPRHKTKVLEICYCNYHAYCRILLYLSNKCTIYINNICFLKHSHMFGLHYLPVICYCVHWSYE